MAAELDEIVGRVIITWPKTVDGVLHPWFGASLTDADTGEELTTVLSFTLAINYSDSHLRSWDAYRVDMTMLSDENDQCLRGRAPAQLAPDGRIRRGTFRWAVAEMRVAE
jgi:hypothetical protein